MHLAVGTGYLSLPLDAHLPPSMEYLGSVCTSTSVSARKARFWRQKVTFASLELPAQGACGALKSPGARLLFSAACVLERPFLPTGKNMATPFFPTPSREQFQPSDAVSTHIPISTCCFYFYSHILACSRSTKFNVIISITNNIHTLLLNHRLIILPSAVRHTSTSASSIWSSRYRQIKLSGG